MTDQPEPEDPTPDDLRTAAALCRATLEPALDRDWNASAGDLAWTCRRTLDHVVDSLLLYAGALATRANGRLTFLRDGDPHRSVAELLINVETAAAILAEVARAAPPEVRAFHPAGFGDPAGFLAMACEEVLVHTDDVARGLGLSFRPPDDALIRRVVRRIFPWSPPDAGPWDAVRWGAGRAALPDQPRLGPDWWFHPAPLAEWDGTVKRRTPETPPAWR
jgi:hypothetical protein